MLSFVLKSTFVVVFCRTIFYYYLERCGRRVTAFLYFKSVLAPTFFCVDYIFSFCGNNFLMKIKSNFNFGSNVDERETRLPRVFDKEKLSVDNAVRNSDKNKTQ